MKSVILIQILSGPIRLHPTKIIKNDSHFTFTSHRTLIEIYVITHSRISKSLFFSPLILSNLQLREREREHERTCVFLSLPLPESFHRIFPRHPSLTFSFIPSSTTSHQTAFPQWLLRFLVVQYYNLRPLLGDQKAQLLHFSGPSFWREMQEGPWKLYISLIAFSVQRNGHESNYFLS